MHGYEHEHEKHGKDWMDEYWKHKLEKKHKKEMKKEMKKDMKKRMMHELDDKDRHRGREFEHRHSSDCFKHGCTSGHERRHERKFSELECKRDKEGRKKWKAVSDMGETDKYWLIRTELPGVKKEKLKVEIEGKDLVIAGKRKKEFWHDKLRMKEEKEMEKGKEKGLEKKEKEKDKGFEKKERREEEALRVKWWKKERGMRGSFKRKIHLPKKVDHSAIEALYKDGVLEILIRKPEGEMKKGMEGGKSIPVH